MPRRHHALGMIPRIIPLLVPPEIYPTGLGCGPEVVQGNVLGVMINQKRDPDVTPPSIFAYHLENVPAGHVFLISE